MANVPNVVVVAAHDGRPSGTNDRKTWDKTTNYYINDNVNWSGVNYVCAVANSGKYPATNPIFWTALPAPVVNTASDQSREAMGSSLTIVHGAAALGDDSPVGIYGDFGFGT